MIKEEGQKISIFTNENSINAYSWCYCFYCNCIIKHLTIVFFKFSSKHVNKFFFFNLLLKNRSFVLVRVISAVNDTVGPNLPLFRLEWVKSLVEVTSYPSEMIIASPYISRTYFLYDFRMSKKVVPLCHGILCRRDPPSRTYWMSFGMSICRHWTIFQILSANVDFVASRRIPTDWNSAGGKVQSS